MSNRLYSLSKNYEMLYLLLCEGNHIPCYVNYNFRSLEGMSPPSRDICAAKRRKAFEISFGARGIEYGSVNSWDKNTGTEKETFIKECERMELEWINPIKIFK